MNAIGSICCSIAKALDSCPIILPPPPVCQRVISCQALRELLRGVCDCPIYVGDHMYELPPLDEYRRFLKWFNSYATYTEDDWDCENFSWELTYFMSKWSGGKSPAGHVYASGNNRLYKFPLHGFNFVVADDLKVYYCDELQLAATQDDFLEDGEVDYKKTKMEII